MPRDKELQDQIDDQKDTISRACDILEDAYTPEAKLGSGPATDKPMGSKTAWRRQTVASHLAIVNPSGVQRR